MLAKITTKKVVKPIRSVYAFGIGVRNPRVPKIPSYAYNPEIRLIRYANGQVRRHRSSASKLMESRTTNLRRGYNTGIMPEYNESLMTYNTEKIGETYKKLPGFGDVGLGSLGVLTVTKDGVPISKEAPNTTREKVTGFLTSLLTQAASTYEERERRKSLEAEGALTVALEQREEKKRQWQEYLRRIGAGATTGVAPYLLVGGTAAAGILVYMLVKK